MAKKIPKIITQEEFEILFNEVKKMEQKAKNKARKTKLKKYRLAMLLGFEGGLRISEVIGFGDRVPPLTKTNVEIASIRIENGKGGKDRVVPRPKRFNDSLLELLPIDIPRRSLQNFITFLGNRVLNKKISFHTLRHGFGSHLAGQNRPLHEIQMLMGHSRLDTTGIYLHANPKQAIDGARDVF